MQDSCGKCPASFGFYKDTSTCWIIYMHISDQNLATSHYLTPKGSWGREIPSFEGNPGWWEYCFIQPDMEHMYHSSFRSPMISVYYGIFTVPSIPKLTHTDYINRCTFRTTHWNTVNVSHPIPGWLLCLGGWMELGYLKFNVATFKVIHVTIRWRKIKNTDLGFVYIRLIFLFVQW